MNIASGVIGGSMSSRLFQEIREKKGLAYSVYTYNQNFSEGGVLSTYIGTNKESYEEAIEITLRSLRNLGKKELQKMSFRRRKINS